MAWVCFTVLMASSVYAAEQTDQVSTAPRGGMFHSFIHSLLWFSFEAKYPKTMTEPWSINATKMLWWPCSPSGDNESELTGKVRGIEDVVVEILLHQYA